MDRLYREVERESKSVLRMLMRTVNGSGSGGGGDNGDGIYIAIVLWCCIKVGNEHAWESRVLQREREREGGGRMADR